MSFSLWCYVRLRIVKSFGWDDGLMVAAMIILVAYTATTIGGAVVGTGRKMGDLTSQELNLRLARLFWWLGQDFYVTACVLAKASICICLWRITINQVHRMFLCLVLAFSILAGLVFFFFTTFQCHPVSHYWNTTIADEKCLKAATIIKVTYAYSAVAATSDFAIGLLPVFIVWNLQMAKARKYGLIGLFGIACVASFAVIIRIPYLQAPSRSEPLYAAGYIIIWSYVEVSAGIIAGSVVTLRALGRVLPGRCPDWIRSPEFQDLTSRSSPQV
ncbi:uncharacterized protein ATNIH1004_011288 [Aspergillus tanneri]|uniref:Rhodopsin domain-containing protein n=1 Tax=Aspergillus tanneri TaxID=1220188 RepID=A0A5M9MAL6_9EURO|nr:uncharacterized protein ATNIH1004_011288 [Aspergillus tanneri]KAA8642344.1 hypothetical protein ATNIH1004_011288 [Aspergillus tanneri]